MSENITIIGGGMSGLSCARYLNNNKIPFKLYESTDRIGGRVGTKRVEECLFDNGFQVSMSNYINLEELVPRGIVPRKQFLSGAIVWDGFSRTKYMDPKCSPLSSIGLLAKRKVSLRDILASLRARYHASKAIRGSFYNGTAEEIIKKLGFTDRFTNEFLRPFFGGVFLDNTLNVQASRFLKTLYAFSSGKAELPSYGMQALPESLSSTYRESIFLNHKVLSISNYNELTFENDCKLKSKIIVLALPLDVSFNLLGLEELQKNISWSNSITIHFKSKVSRIDQPIIFLNGSGKGNINLISSSTSVCSTYSSSDVNTFSVGCNSYANNFESIDINQIKFEASQILGIDTDDWQYVRTDEIKKSLPVYDYRSFKESIPDNIYLVGDGLADPSIDSAVKTGVDAAKQIINKMKFGTNY